MSITILSGMRLTPERLNALAPATTRRTSDLSVTNSIAVVDGLTVPVLANAEYDVEALLIYEAPTGNDMRVLFDWPSGTMPWGMLALDSAATGVFGDLRPTAFGAPTNGTSTFVLGGGGAGNQLLASVRGTLVTSGTGGNLKLRFAQGAAAAGTSAVLKAGSTLQVRRIA